MLLSEKKVSNETFLQNLCYFEQCCFNKLLIYVMKYSLYAFSVNIGIYFLML
jgi:hypothetical protein